MQLLCIAVVGGHAGGCTGRSVGVREGSGSDTRDAQVLTRLGA